MAIVTPVTTPSISPDNEIIGDWKWNTSLASSAYILRDAHVMSPLQSVDEKRLLKTGTKFYQYYLRTTVFAKTIIATKAK